jgi:hypothetical protein
MKKLTLDPDRLTVESFEAVPAGSDGTVRGYGAGCSIQPTCGNPSRGDETFVEEALTRYACCV